MLLDLFLTVSMIYHPNHNLYYLNHDEDQKLIHHLRIMDIETVKNSSDDHQRIHDDVKTWHLTINETNTSKNDLQVIHIEDETTTEVHQ